MLVSFQLGKLLSTLLALVETRLELFAVELREEQQRLVVVLVLCAFGVGLGLAAVVTATAAVMALLNPANQPVGWLIAAAVYAAACIVLWLVVRHRLHHRPPPFAESRAELERDRLWL